MKPALPGAFVCQNADIIQGAIHTIVGYRWLHRVVPPPPPPPSPQPRPVQGRKKSDRLGFVWIEGMLPNRGTAEVLWSA